MSDDLEGALGQARNGAGAGPKRLGMILIELVESAPGRTETTVSCSIADELQARGLYQKAGVVLEMILAQRAAASTPRVVGAQPRPPFWQHGGLGNPWRPTG